MDIGTYATTRFLTTSAVLFLSYFSMVTYGQDIPEQHFPPREVTFLEGEAAREAVAAEIGESYLSVLSDQEMTFKIGRALQGISLEARRESFVKHYLDGLVLFTEQEKQALQGYAAMADHFLAEKYPDLAEIPWTFTKISDGHENGLECTFGHVIAMRAELLSKISDPNYIGPNNVHYVIFGMLQYLVEKKILAEIHSDHESFYDFYQRTWGFIKLDILRNDAWRGEIEIRSPNTITSSWCINLGDPEAPTYVLTTRFSNTPLMRGEKTQRDLSSVGVFVEQDVQGRWQTLLNNNGDPRFGYLSGERFRSRFDEVPIPTSFHPNLIFAHMAAKAVLFDLEIYPQLFLADGDPGIERKLRAERQLGPVRDFLIFRYGGDDADAVDAE
ncbi:MAG: hypothetical protein AAGI37_04205 [Planctomycetota bacterium]